LCGARGCAMVDSVVHAASVLLSSVEG